MIDATKGFTILQSLEGSPEQAWRAWTEPVQAARWWRPSGTTTPRESIAMDVRPGGRYVYTMINDETGEEMITGGVYRELTPFARLEFTWGEPDGDPDETPVVTVILEPVDDSTLMTFELRGVDGHKGDGFFYDGWDEVLTSLGRHIGNLPSR
ncbi:MAG: SRPBCC family protein [Arachnia sp.]